MAFKFFSSRTNQIDNCSKKQTDFQANLQNDLSLNLSKYPSAHKISESPDGSISLFGLYNPKGKKYTIQFNDKNLNIFTQKEFFHDDTQKLSITVSALGNNGFFSILLDTYYPQDPHTDESLYLYDQCGHTRLYCFSDRRGMGKFKFSETSRYFVVLEYCHILIYDTETGYISSFYPTEFERANCYDFDIDEIHKTLSFQYDQYPDKPILRFSFDGELLDKELLNEQIEKQNKPSEYQESYFQLLHEIDTLPRPIAKDECDHYVSTILSYIDKPGFSDSDPYMYRRIGQVYLDSDDKKNALLYFNKALNIDPNIGVKRIASKLLRELNSQI